MRGEGGSEIQGDRRMQKDQKGWPALPARLKTNTFTHSHVNRMRGKYTLNGWTISQIIKSTEELRRMS